MWTFYHGSVFLLTFTSYAFFHATRKTFSNVKSTISSEWSATPGNITHPNKPNLIWNSHHMFNNSGDVETYLGVLDAVFMVSYAVGLYISGIIGDRFELRKVLSFGMCSAALSVFLFGSVLEWGHYYNKYLYVAVWILNGLLQSTGWPTVVAIMGNWFGKSGRGFVLGLWSSCASVGNIIGALMVSQVLNYGYDFAFMVTSSVLFGGGILIFFGLVNTPEDIGLKNGDDVPQVQDVDVIVNRGHGHSRGQSNSDLDPDDDADTEPLLEQSEHTESTDEVRVCHERDEALSFGQALLLPGVLMYAFAYFCLKLVNYSFFFWLPYYLHASFGWLESRADEVSIWYDIGGIVGGTIAGVISDCIGKRSVVVVPMLILAIPSLIAYSNSPNDIVTNAVLMTITGYFIGGVSNLISAAISADLGKQGAIQGNKAALATVTGIVDGTGSVGAALGQILVPVIQEKLGWHSVFYLFIIMTILTGLFIMPMFIREVPECYWQIRLCCRRHKYTWYCGLHLKQAARNSSTNDSDSITDESERILVD